mgnify:CR=1 FL=1
MEGLMLELSLNKRLDIIDLASGTAVSSSFKVR